MALKQFLQNLFERVGLAETLLPPPQEACIALAESEQTRATLRRLAAWGVQRVQFVAANAPDARDAVQAARQAADLGMEVGIRGQAIHLAVDNLLPELAAAGVQEVELPFLSAVAEVHDAAAGIGDYRSVLKAFDALAGRRLRAAIQLVLAPSTWKTIQRTMEMLDDRGVRVVRLWTVVSSDDKPASWALSARELVDVAAWIEAESPREIHFAWYPPLKFDPARTLAQQVRSGPRARRNAVRIEADGSILPPIGPPTAGGNVAQNDWKLIARSEVFRAWKRRRDAAARCEQCPGLAACEGGCLRDEGNWTAE